MGSSRPATLSAMALAEQFIFTLLNSGGGRFPASSTETLRDWRGVSQKIRMHPNAGECGSADKQFDIVPTLYVLPQ